MPPPARDAATPRSVTMIAMLRALRRRRAMMFDDSLRLLDTPTPLRCATAPSGAPTRAQLRVVARKIAAQRRAVTAVATMPHVAPPPCAAYGPRCHADDERVRRLVHALSLFHALRLMPLHACSTYFALSSPSHAHTITLFAYFDMRRLLSPLAAQRERDAMPLD